MIDIILTITALIFLIIASIQDLRKREVMDWLNYTLIGYAILLRAVFSIYEKTFVYIQDGVLGLIAGVILGYIMFYTGQWGGGDSKLLMGMGALIGLKLSFASKLPIFVLNIFIAGAIYGLFFSIYLVWKNKKAFTKKFREQFAKFRKLHSILLITGLAVLISLKFVDKFTAFMFVSVSLLAYFLFYLILFAKVVEKTCMIKLYHPKELTEGDWIVDEIKYKNKVIASPKDLGLTKPQIAKIQKLYAEKKINKILVKEGIPFVPSFLIAYIMIMSLGNWIVYFI